MKKSYLLLTIIMAAVIMLPNSVLAQSYDDIYVIEETAPIPANETKKERK